MTALLVLSTGADVSIQDFGRVGLLGQGVSRGGAADMRALYEGAALLGHTPECAALEMPGFGATFEATGPMRIALTGAQMRATQNGRPIPPNVSIPVETGDILNIQAATAGTYGYLNVGGGFDVPEILGARGAHLRAGLGAAIQTGDRLPTGDDPNNDTMQTLTPEPRLAGGALRAVHSIQTNRFSPSDLSRFQATAFRRDPRANRMGLRLDYDGVPFTAADQLNVLSEIIVPGDIQMTGDGTPYILMPECQTTGGYPRIGTIIPSDLPRAAQAPVGAPLTIQFITLTEATEIERRTARELAHLAGILRPLVRDPHDIPDLLSYQLIDGVISGKRSE